jgi:oligopeptide transport system substrate-binding protein
MSQSKWSIVIKRALAFALFLAAISAQSAVEPRKFSLRLPGEPETLDWNLAHTMVETYLLMNLMDGLVTLDHRLEPKPDLAQSWSVSSDGKIYTFRLKPGVLWSDGVPLKAKDFVYSWRRLLSPLTAASYAYFLFDVEGAEDFNRGKIKDFSQVGVQALDDQTLQVRLARPVPHWIYIPSFWVTFPLRQDVVEKHGHAWSKPGRMVTLGAFTLTTYDSNSRVVMRSNAQYHRPKGNIDEVTGLIVSDDATALNLYESEKIDFLTDLSTLDMKRLAGRADLKNFPYLKTAYLGFNVTQSPTSNVKFRRAVAQAIDRSQIPKLLQGAQVATPSLLPPPLLGHRFFGLPFNPKAARAELDASGLSLGGEFKIDFLIPNFDKTLLWSQFVQAELKKNLGIRVNVAPFDHKTFRANLDLKRFPLFAASWGADYPDSDNFLSIFLSKGGNNRTGWGSADYDRNVLAARGEKDPKIREKHVLAALELLITREAAIVPLYHESNQALVKPRVKGLRLSPLNTLLLRDVSVDVP